MSCDLQTTLFRIYRKLSPCLHDGHDMQWLSEHKVLKLCFTPITNPYAAKRQLAVLDFIEITFCETHLHVPLTMNGR